MKEPHTALFIAPTGVGKTHLVLSLLESEYRNHFNFIVTICPTLSYCLTKTSIWAKRSISCVFSLFIVPSPFFVHCPYKGRINQAESILTAPFGWA